MSGVREWLYELRQVRSLRELCCFLGFHVVEPIHEDAYGTHGGDCMYCGLGPW